MATRTTTARRSRQPSHAAMPVGTVSPPLALAVGAPIPASAPRGGSLADLLIRAAADPAAGMVFVRADETELRVTYAELLTLARRRLAGLRAAGLQQGALAPLVFSEGMDFVVTFWACMLGGIVAVPMSFPTSFSQPSHGLQKMFEVWRQLGRPVILGDALLARHRGEAVAATGVEGAEGLQVLDAATLDRDDGGLEHSLGQGDELAFIQYSSGSTGSPKGVALSHRNLLSNVEAIATAIEMRRADTVLSWMPYSHDMGLIGMHLVPMLKGADQVNLLPQGFVRRPLLWLEKIAQHRAVFTGSPNFGYRLVLERLAGATPALDLSSLRAIFNGAEPISVAMLREFVAALRPAGLAASAMYPVYGMAEACVAVTFPPIGSVPLVRSVDRVALAKGGAVRAVAEDHADALLVVDEGRPVPGCSVRIVDDRGTVVAEGTVGHVQISGDNVTRGYFNNPQANDEAFDGAWLRTGDLGFLADGRLSITGRVKDIVIVNGQKYFAYDIESCVEGLAGVRPGKVAVCGWHDAEAGRERCVLFVAVKVPKGDPELTRQVLAAAWRQVNQTFSIALDHVVLVRQVPRTTSGKLQRYQLRQAWIDGEFRATTFDAAALAAVGPAAAAPAPAAPPAAPASKVPALDEIRQRVRRVWAEVLGRDAAAIPLDQSFLTLGGTSIKAVQVLGGVEQAFATRLDHAFLLECRTVAAMAEHLARHLSARVPTVSSPRPAPAPAPAAAPADGGEIAIIGMACRFPQAATPEVFWTNLVEGRDAITEVPSDRWNADLYDRAGAAPSDRVHARWGGFIADAHAFDAGLFGIAPEEAAIMDPQQRLFLQVTWEALERAGCSGAGSEGRRVGVFVGASHNNYMEHHLHGLDLARLQQFQSFGALPPAQREALVGEWKQRFGEPGTEANTAVDNLLNMIAARTSHALNLKGPSLAIDTACSSSLVAVHLACDSLRRGECEMAVAGGVSLNLSPTPYLLFSRAGTLSPDGRCKVFDADADGFVPGEGVGSVVLKPLARALADGDNVLAVIKGSSVNNDGRSLGVMAPNPDGQRVAIASVYADGRLRPRDIQYVEAHGTGTAIGDPSELRALAHVFADGREPAVAAAPCVVGSVKANIGHLLSAAGVASLIKVVLALQARQMPPSLHLRRPQAQLAAPDAPFQVLTAAQPWTVAPGTARRAAINSFGFGGTNCHMVIEEGPAALAPAVPAAARPLHLLCLSARSSDALRQRATELAAHLLAQPQLAPADVCHTQHVGRRHFEQRLSVVADSLAGLAEKLIGADAAPPARAPAVALMFTGQGAQYPGMARRLYETLPAFARAVDDCAAAFAPHLDVPLLDSLYGPGASAEAMAQTRLTQPLMFTIDYALGRLWLDWGLQPACLLGHSVGEYAAACLAGVMSLADAAAVVAARGRLINALPGGGGMAAVFDSHDAVAAQLQPFAGRLWFGAHNGPQQVVSGELGALDELQARMAAQGKLMRRLQVSHAFHTPLLAPMLEEFSQVLARVEFAPPRVPIVSNVGGAWLAGQPLGADHWLAHVTAPVCFEQSVRLAADRGIGAFVECGPDKILSGLARAALGGRQALVLPSLDRKAEDWSSLLGAMGRLYEAGIDFDWHRYAAGTAPRRLVLPTYPFAREVHRIATSDAVIVPAEGARTPSPSPALVPVAAAAHGVPALPPATDRGPSRHWCEVVQGLVAEVTRCSPLQVDMYRNFHDLGLDSASAVTLAERLSALARTKLPPTLLFEYQSPQALVDHLCSVATLHTDASAPAPVAAPVAVPAAAPAASSKLHCVPHEAAADRDPARREHDIAIVGMALRVPGADTLDEYWQMLVEGRTAIREVRPDQWSLPDYFSSGKQRSHTSYSKWGAFLEQPYHFDPLFFGISPREAEVMDPQQRLFLQVAWEALQQSGYGGDFRTREIGIFVGCEQNHYGEHFIMNQRYQALRQRLDAMPWLDGLPAAQREQLRTTLRDVLQPAELISDAVAGQGLNEIAARVSHWLDLRGPNLVLNTACSSSLVALHLACESLRAGESRMAICGATYLTGNDSPFVFLSRLGALSPTGRCSPFDERADGMVLGEGVSAVVLKPLKDALRDGDHVHAVIKGSAVNNDGHSNGITAPNPRGQADAMRKAYLAAGLTPDDVSYIECHGTGTPLGDPVELDGMTQAFRKFTDRRHFCAIGSVKSTVGHMLSGSSLPGVIKVALALQRRVIPPTYGYDKPNPHIDFANSPFYVAAGRPLAWVAPGEAPLRAGVNSFGFGGTNCHLLLEEAPRPVASAAPTVTPQLLLLSGRTQAVLQQVAARLQGALDQHPEYGVAQVCRSMNGAQRDLAFKAALLVRDDADLRAKLTALTTLEAGRDVEGVQVRRSNPKQAPHTTLVLDGVNPLSDREVEELIAAHPQLQQICDDCTRHYSAAMQESNAMNQQHLDGLLFSFAVQYGLGRLLLATELRPSAIVAEGTGVLAGACLLGMLSLEQATSILCRYALGRQDAMATDDRVDERTDGPPCALVIPGAVLQRKQDHIAARLAGYLLQPRRLAAADVRDLGQGDHAYVHLGGAAELREQLGVQDRANWLSLQPAAHGHERLLALFGALYVRGLRFDSRPLAAAGSRRVPLPTYPFENKVYRVGPVALDAPAPQDQAVPAPAPAGLVPIVVAPTPLPSPVARLLPVADSALSLAQRKVAHDALRDELSHLLQA